jgi:transcription termination factor NusB
MILTWAERCKKFDDGEIITNELIQEVMQEEIDDLRKELALQKLFNISQKIEQEPVAWMSNGKEFYVQKNYCPDFIPLYTHANEDRDSAIYATGYWKGIEKAKEKNETLDTRSYLIGRYDGLRELTDEEIDNLIMNVVEKPTNEDLYDFARAILRKASEK